MYHSDKIVSKISIKKGLSAEKSLFLAEALEQFKAVLYKL